MMEKAMSLEARGAQTEALLEGPCRIVDILPAQVPAEMGERYSAVEEYFLQPARLRTLRRRYAEVLLRLSCYFPMAVSFDYGESWEDSPGPEDFAERLEGMAAGESLRALFEAQSVLVCLDACDTYMSVFGEDAAVLDKLCPLAAGEGLFVWQPPGVKAADTDGKVVPQEENA